MGIVKLSNGRHDSFLTFLYSITFMAPFMSFAVRVTPLSRSIVGTGQHVAALEFLLPEEYIRTLKVLHANAPTSSLDSVKKVLSEELGRPYEEVFEDFDETPLGCASLAQVRSFFGLRFFPYGSGDSDPPWGLAIMKDVVGIPGSQSQTAQRGRRGR